MKVLIFFTIVLQLSTLVVFGQDSSVKDLDAQKSRPKIGLVLSGGGARGFAHVGVLKVLEENRIPVDYIAGASMGALVGSLYSIGKSPAEMEELVETLDWDKLLSGSPSYEELAYRRKQDKRNLPGSLSLNGRGVKSLKLPSSLNPGHEIGLAIDRIFFPYSQIENFDNMPIPFRTVGTDMINAQSVVLKSGSLQQSLRASMAIPAVFAPVEINGRTLADGGILNNIPTNIAKEMGADIILVVNIETQIGGRESLDDLLGVLGQTFNVVSAENSRRSLRQADLIIAPDLENYSSSNFNEGKAIIELGYSGAKKKVSILQGLSLSEDEWQAHLSARRKRQIPETIPTTEFLAVEGADTSKERQIVRDKLSDRYKDKPINKNALEKDLTELTGTRRFDSLGYEATTEDDKKGLLVRVYDSEERTARRTSLEVGIEVNNTQADTTNFNLRGRLTYFNIGGFGSEWRNDFSIGSQTSISTEFFRRINESRFFIAPNALYRNRDISFYENEERLAEFESETAKIGFDIGYSINSKSELRLGYQIGRQRITRKIGDPLISDLSGSFSLASLDYEYDGADKSQIPTRGIRTSSSLRYYFDAPGAEYGFPQAETNFNMIYPVTENFLGFSFGAGGTSFGRTATPIQQFPIGGLFNVGGYGSDEFRGSNFARGGIGILRETYALPRFFGGKIYLGGWYEGGSSFENLNKAIYRQSVTTGILTETPFGPIFVGGSFAEGGRRRIYFSLGRFF